MIGKLCTQIGCHNSNTINHRVAIDIKTHNICFHGNTEHLFKWQQRTPNNALIKTLQTVIICLPYLHYRLRPQVAQHGARVYVCVTACVTHRIKHLCTCALAPSSCFSLGLSVYSSTGAVQSSECVRECVRSLARSYADSDSVTHAFTHPYESIRHSHSQSHS